MNAIIAQILGAVALLTVIVIIYLKDIRKILIGEIIANCVVALNYLLLSGFSGAGLCVSATVHTIGAYCYSLKNKKFPLLLMWLFIAIYLAWMAISYQSPLDLLPGICSLLFAFAIMQSNPARYRVFKVANALIWVFYDFFVCAYSTGITHVVLFVLGLIVIFRLDIIPKPEIAAKTGKL